jgi:hypothetical protein
VDFINKKYIVGFEVGEDGRQVAGALDSRPGGRLDTDAYLGGDDMGQAGLAEAGRTVKENMIEGFAAAFGCRDGNLEVVLGLVLPDKIGQGTRPEAVFQGGIIFSGLSGNYASYGFTPSTACRMNFTVFQHCG